MEDNKVILPVNLMNAIMHYLEQRPLKEVINLYQAVQKEAVLLQDAPEGTKVEKV